MRELTLSAALEETLQQNLNEDKRILAFECRAFSDTPSSTWQNLQNSFNTERVKSVGGHVSAVVGLSIGAAIAGLRPIIRLHSPTQFTDVVDFYSNAANCLPDLTNGDLDAPLVTIIPSGPGLPYGTQHEISIENICAIIPKISVVFATGAYEIKGLLSAALHTDQPVIILESPLDRDCAENVPENLYSLSLDETPQILDGNDLTLIAWGHNLKIALNVAGELKNNNIHAEVINLRALSPFNNKTIADSINKTHRAIIIDDGPQSNSFADYLACRLQNELFSQLNSPILKISRQKELVCYTPRLAESENAFTQHCLSKIRGKVENS